MAEEATDLPSGQHSARVRVLVARQHLYSQSLQLGRVESPERDGEGERTGRSGKRRVIVGENGFTGKTPSGNKQYTVLAKQQLDGGLGHSQRWIKVSAERGK